MWCRGTIKKHVTCWYKHYLKGGVEVPGSTRRMRALRQKRAELRIANENLNTIQHPNLESNEPGTSNTSEPTTVELHPPVVNQHETAVDIGERIAFTSQPRDTEEATSYEVLSESFQPAEQVPEHQQTFITEHESEFHECLPPLCSHTECTADDVMLMVLSVGLRHKFTWAAMVDILKVFNTLYSKKKINTATYSFSKRFFESENLSVSYHYFCDNCAAYIYRSDSSKEAIVCENCHGNINSSKKADYFVSLSLESQLKNMLSNEPIAEMIMNYRFTRSKDNDDHFEDIHDGLEYKKHSAAGKILSFRENFSFSFFTDGVPLGKSKKSLWPIYISINELSPHERRHHILLVGLYCGPRDPNQRVFLKPFVEEANKLATDGFSWTYKGSLIHSKVIALVGVADSVARYQLLNFQTCSAFFGCTFCYQKTTRTTKRLKFTLPNKRVEERALESTRQDLVQVYERRHAKNESERTWRGVKGPSVLSSLLYFNIHTGFVVDYMHNILLGVTRTYFELVFDSTRRKFWGILEDEVYATQDLMSEIDKRMQFFKPPSSISRTPRSIKDFGSWKANEWRTWLLFYCVPCLVGLMKEKHLIHIAMLSKATSLLLQTSVSRAEILIAHELFQKFSFLSQKYFGPEHMYYNVHLLSHICKGVLRWGPLWTHNAFMYEGYNRQLLFFCKNPFRVVMEISKKYQVMNALPRLINKFSSCDSSLFLCEDILDRKLVRYKRCNSYILLGVGKVCDLTQSEKEYLETNNLFPSKCLFYNRMLYKGMRITTAEYSSKFKNDDSLVFSACELCYQIRAIIVPSEDSVCLLAKTISLSDNEVLLSEELSLTHVSKIQNIGDLTVFTPDHIKGQCIGDTQSGMFLSKLPASYYYGD